MVHAMRNAYQLNQLDKKLKKASVVKQQARPKNGWIFAIRNALAMSRAQMAFRINVTRDAIQKIEQSEVANTISLSTLQKVANAVGCDVYYVLLPKDKSLLNFVTNQAKKIARKAVLNSAKHMDLENQSVRNKIDEQIEFLVDELLHKKLKDLWKYEV